MGCRSTDMRKEAPSGHPRTRDRTARIRSVAAVAAVETAARHAASVCRTHTAGNHSPAAARRETPDTAGTCPPIAQRSDRRHGAGLWRCAAACPAGPRINELRVTPTHRRRHTEPLAKASRSTGPVTVCHLCCTAHLFRIKSKF